MRDRLASQWRLFDMPGLAAAERAGVNVDKVTLDALEEARAFRLRRHELQVAQVERLAHELPLPQLCTPRLFEPAIGPDQLDRLASALRLGVPQPRHRAAQSYG